MTDWSLGTYELTAAQLAPAAERAVEAAEILPGDRVVDVACGTGNAALLAAMRGARVTGLDRAARLLEVAAGRARAAGVEIDWRTGDAEALPFEDGAFDVALSVFGVIFAPMAPAVAELVRVTAPGGRIVLVTWTGEGAIAAGSGVLRRAMEAAGTSEAAALPADREPPSAGPGPGPTEPAAEDGDAGADGDAGTSRESAGDGDAVAGGDAGAARVAAADRDAGPGDWGDPTQLERAFVAHGGSVSVERYAHAFEGESPEAFADEWMARHPLWLTGREVLGAEAFEALRAPLVSVLRGANEDPDGFRATSTALLAHVQLP